MKKLILLFLLILPLSLGGEDLFAQTTFQHHYVLGKKIYKSRKSDAESLLTLDHFSVDKWGDNFFFVDFQLGGKNMREAYFEISRNLKFWDGPFAAHLEYNGGLNQAFPINHAILTGVHWSHVNLEHQWNVGVALMHRYAMGNQRHHNIQLTTTWGWTSWNRLWTISGFMDLWSQKLPGSKAGVVLLSEPQLWLNINQFVGVPEECNLSIGGEVKISYNFLHPNKFYVIPTLAAKWTFN